MLLFRALALFILISGLTPAFAQLKTWDGKHAIDKIEVTVVYFLPRDRTPLPDWKERAEYYCRRIEKFHAREFGEQSTLKAVLREEPLRSARTTEQLRSGDGDFVFFQTLREADAALNFARGERTAFPILLVLSDINRKPLDDFWRARPDGQGGWEFEGNYNRGRHFPGAESGGARATYLSDRGVGWGLVSGDGWRVPYCGSDCVVYHEGVGHTIGLPHPEPADRSVMSLAQYHGWISESFVNAKQKERLGYKPPPGAAAADTLFTKFTALPSPTIPLVNEAAGLRLTWPDAAALKSLRLRIQTDIAGPWREVAVALPDGADPPEQVTLGKFDHPTPVSYRLDVELTTGEREELWGYFQVRAARDTAPFPLAVSEITAPREKAPAKLAEPKDAVDLLALIDVEKDKVAGDWTRDGAALVSPKAYGSRIEIPYLAPEEYELTAIVEPLDEPNGLIFGHRSGESRFLTVLSYPVDGRPASALENVRGLNINRNETTVKRSLFVKNRPSQVICTVRKDSVTVLCDGRELLRWEGRPQDLSLGEYWQTPRETALFLGAYDCRYKFSRVTLTAIRGEGKPLR